MRREIFRREFVNDLRSGVMYSLENRLSLRTFYRPRCAVFLFLSKARTEPRARARAEDSRLSVPFASG